jgi:hypothetical protein
MRLPDEELVDAAMQAYWNHSWRGQRPLIYEAQMPELLAVLGPVLDEFNRKRSRVPARKPAKVNKGREGPCRDLVRKRSGGTCERCSVRLAESMHHRRFRSQGGPWAPSNILHLCGDGTTGCHGVLTNTKGQRDEFEAAGWIVPSHADWRETPVLRHGEFVILLDDGGLEPVEKGAA